MGQLNDNQIRKIEGYLQAEGLTFSPLKDELLDHILSDLEIRVGEGQEFESAWETVKKEIPTNHLKHIEIETMETFNSKFNLTRILIGMSGATLIIGALLKLFHLPGAGIMLISFLALVSLTLLHESTRSIFTYRESKGRWMLISITLSVIAFIASLCFKILHLPGVNELAHFSVLSIAIMFPLASIYFYNSKQKLKDHLLIILAERNRKVLETASVILLGFGLLFYYSSGPEGKTQFMGVIFMVFTVIITGLFVYMKSWLYFVNMNDTQRKGVGLLLLISSVTAMVMFILPAWGQGMDHILRNLLAYGAFIIFTLIVIVHYLKYSDSPGRRVLAPLSSFLLFYPFFRLGANLEWFEGFLTVYATNYYSILGQIVFLCVLLIVYRKEPLFKAQAIIIIASNLIIM